MRDWADADVDTSDRARDRADDRDRDRVDFHNQNGTEPARNNSKVIG
jgi:hypothetical protein